jgi:hypothetical protein
MTACVRCGGIGRHMECLLHDVGPCPCEHEVTCEDCGGSGETPPSTREEMVRSYLSRGWRVIDAPAVLPEWKTRVVSPQWAASEGHLGDGTRVHEAHCFDGGGPLYFARLDVKRRETARDFSDVPVAPHAPAPPVPAIDWRKVLEEKARRRGWRA